MGGVPLRSHMIRLGVGAGFIDGRHHGDGAGLKTCTAKTKWGDPAHKVTPSFRW